MRLTVGELKKFLKDQPDDSAVFVDVYDSKHHREFLYTRSYSSNQAEDTEIQVAKTDLSEKDL